MIFDIGASVVGGQPWTIDLLLDSASFHIAGVAFLSYVQPNNYLDTQRRTCVDVDWEQNNQAIISSQLSTPRKDLYILAGEQNDNPTYPYHSLNYRRPTIKKDSYNTFTSSIFISRHPTTYTISTYDVGVVHHHHPSPSPHNIGAIAARPPTSISIVL